ncbi:eCIS core domain-containing protein [Streptomyces prasinus]|uniref:eCIS core domain-containing protein n=1 Tax=Streptomyces prasinus TaxID=67345 RepID=UPI0036AE9BEF
MHYDTSAQTAQSPRVPSRRPAKPAPTRQAPAAAAPGHRSPAALAAIQRSAGNAAVVQMLAEERAAEEHRHGAGCGHQPVQRSSVDQALSSPGAPLEPAKREEMEARLGADFSDVRVHTGSVAQRSATDIGAKAYTAGNHVVIGQDGADDHTLAHELTHVIQQRSGPVDGTVGADGLKVSDPSDRFEKAAEANASRVMSGPVPAVQRALSHEASASAATEASVQRTHYATGKTEHDPESDNYDSDEDNIDAVAPNLRRPTAYSTVLSLVAEGSAQEVVLWRGTTLSRALAMESNGSAGGAASNAGVAAPERTASRRQVGHGGRLPEFTAREGVAESFSTGGALVVVRIAAKYLTPGSSTEEGFVADPTAPLEVLDLVDRTRGAQTGRRIANAS